MCSRICEVELFCRQAFIIKSEIVLQGKHSLRNISFHTLIDCVWRFSLFTIHSVPVQWGLCAQLRVPLAWGQKDGNGYDSEEGFTISGHYVLHLQ